jgi:PAS domain S-box-containing protein
MRRLARPVLLMFLAALLAGMAAFALLGRSGGDARRHADTLAALDALAEAETSLDRDLLRVMAGLLPHYDTLVLHGGRLRQLLDGLQGGTADLPDGALDDYRRLVTAKLAAAEQIKAASSMVNKEGAYLPFAVERYAAAMSPARAVPVQQALIGLTTGTAPAAADRLAAVVAGFAAAADPVLAGIGEHMQVLLEQRQVLADATTGYFTIDSRLALDRARDRYMAAYGARQDRSAVLESGLQALAVALFLALGVAISRLGRAQEQAEQAHGQLVDAVDSLHEAFALFDHGRRLVLCNARYDALFPGHGRIEGFRPLLAVMRPWAVEGEAPLADGGPQQALVVNPVDGRSHLFRSQPTAGHGVVCLFTDITEHRLAETQIRKLTAAVEQSPVAIVITDAEARMEYVNPRFLEMTGYAQDEVLGRNPSLLKSGEVVPTVYEEMWKTIAAGLTWRGELVNRRKNGELYWESTTISPIRDGAGRITHYVALKEDITQRKANEDLLLHANTDVERMLFAASHDLQEPVRLMQTYCQRLDRQLPPEAAATARESMDFIMAAARQAGLLINGLAAYSRSGHPSDAFAPVDCANVARRAVAECLSACPQLNPLIRIDHLPVVQGDSVLLVMLLENLIGNALKFRHPERAPEVTISAERDGALWRIDIADNGIGIERDYLPTITQPFSRLFPRATHPGAGLGLASCVKIARAHGGRLAVESQAGQGTVVHVWLPAVSP